MTGLETPLPLDGNAAAGDLGEVFRLDVTSARGVCASCGRDDLFGQAHLYGGQVGHVLRCASCDAVLMRLVKTPHGTWLEMQGLRSLRFALAQDN